MQKTANTFREALQDVSVPELRSVKVSIDALRTEMQFRDERQTSALNSLREEVRLRTESLREEIRGRGDQQAAAMQHLSEKLDTAIQIRERLVQLEARLPRTQ